MRAHVAFLFLLLAGVPYARAESKCLDAEGEAVIVNNDLPSAKAEAVARAKWSAIEDAVGVDVKAQSVVQNMMLVDEAVMKDIKGAVSRLKVLSQKVEGESVSVRINACVESGKGKDAVAGLALNNAVSVFILAKDPAQRGAGDYEDSNILSESVIGTLADQGYKVVDIAPTHAVEGSVVDSTLKSGKLLGVRTLMYKFLTNVVLVGKVDYNVSTKKGEDVGYGISMPFNQVTARINYRLISKDPSGNMVVLAAGSEQGKGLAGTVQDAAAEGLKNLAEKLTPVLSEKIGEHVKRSARKVAVKIAGVDALGENFAIKEALQNIAWVSEVTEKGIGTFTVTYSENPIYLANSITQKPEFKLQKYAPNAIELKYQK